MRQLQCIQAKSIIKVTFEVLAELSDLKEAEDIGGVWKENILPAFYHLKHCPETQCRTYHSEIHDFARRITY